MVGVKTASMAWPMLWPKFTRLRRLVSCSSTVMMWDLMEIEPMMTLRRRSWAVDPVDFSRLEKLEEGV